MMYRWGATLVLAFLLFSAKTKGQNIAFNYLTVENGLSHNAVLSITQDSRGFMWYGTRYGLNRYDGQRFKIYKTDPKDSTSLNDNLVLTLYCDSKKTLWVGTSQGLNRYDPVKDQFERITITPKPLSIYAIFEDKKGRLWVGSPSGLYLRTNKDFRHFVADGKGNSIAGTHVRCIYEDQKGILWIGTTNGLTRLTITGDDFEFETFRHEEGNPRSLPINYVSSITADNQQRLWIGMLNGGVSVYEPATRSFTHVDNIINNSVRRIIRDKAGKLWVGTQEGLTIIDPDNKTSVSYQHDPGGKKSLSQNSIHSLFEDVNGSVWIGTYFGGINMIHSYNTPFSTLQNNASHSGISNNVVSSILEDKQHNLWIGTEGGGLNYLDRKTGNYTYYKHNPNDPSSLGSNLVKVVYFDKDGNMWVGTHGGGLNLLDPKTGKFTQHFYDKQDPYTLTLETTAILEDTEGRFWVGTNTGLHLFKRNGTQLTEIRDTALLGEMSGSSVRYLFEDSRHRVWIGSTFYQYVVKGNTRLEVNTDCFNNSIMEDSQGNIWTSLYYGGLIKYDPEMKIIARYTDKDGLPSNNIMGILEDHKQNFWISSDNGLTKFDPAKKTFQTYTTSDGIAGNEFNYGSFLEDSKGEFFFGGYNGITSFFPEKIEANTYSAPMVFTSLKLFNQPVGINKADHILKQDIGFTKAIKLQHDQEVFTIEYALLNYIKSNKNRYAYKLEGVDRDWIETNVNSVTYTNLPSGSYTFLVKGANNDGIWSAPARLSIRILPPFWLTWWAWCIYALLAASIFFLVTRFFFMRALLTKEEELHQVKLNFFTNISHEIRTHLTLLMAPVEKMISTYQKDDPVQQQLFNVRNNAHRLLKLVSELMDFRKAETNHLKLYVEKQDLIPFLQEIYTSFSELSLSRNIKTSFVHNSEHTFIYFDREQLEKVFFNLLSNAFKFTPDGGTICLNVEQQKDIVTVSVIDNGRGIAPEYLNKLFSNFFQVADHGKQNTGYGIGLALSRNIVELHKGSLTVESEPAKRTCFMVTLLQGSRHFEGTQHVLGNKPAEEIPEPLTTVPDSTPEVLGHNPSDHPFTLLIVEDNPELRKLIRETFEHSYQVLESENGALGLAMATEQIPDLVISDVMMPEMDGLEFCSRLKTDERTSHIPVVMLTAKSSQADHVSGLEKGADLYLSKPFSTKVLELNVRNLLALREKMRAKYSRQLLAEIPETPEPISNTVDDAFLQKVIQLVEEHMDEPEFGVEMLSRKVAMSQPVLYKKLKALTDMSVNDFIKSLRLKKAASLILKKQHTVYEVAYMVGYADRKYFSKEFKKQFGKTPTEFAGERETE